MDKIKIYFAGIHAGKRPIDLACALGVGGFSPEHGDPGPEFGKYDQLNDEAGKYFESVEIDRAELVVYANKAYNTWEVMETSEMARARELPCVFVSWGDSDEPVFVPHGMVFRHSVFAYTQLPIERALPAFCSDPLGELKQEFKARPWQSLPSIGFCGYVDTSAKRLVYKILGHREKAAGLNLRYKTLQALEHCPRVKTEFIRRLAFRAGAWAKAYLMSGMQYKVRKEFLDNVLENDYTLCIRGAGNFSYRFYETLAAGRIPLFVNTRCVLPFADEIDWRKHCVWVEEENLERAGDVLADFHASLSPERFAEMQESNRQLWLTRLCPLEFYRHAIESVLKMANAEQDSNVQ